MALKLLKPTMRDKKHYLLLKGSFSKKDVEDAIKEYVGVLGFAKATPIWVSNNILAVNRKEVNNVRASLVVSGKDISVARVSGTLKKLRN